jgi:hypothetical protein
MVKHLRCAVIVVAACGLVLAQDKPNFSGEWRMNPEKSDYGMVPKPDKMTRKIAHNEPNLLISTAQSGPQGEIASELKLVIDGKEQTNKVGNAEVKSTPRWEGRILRIDSKRPFQNGELIMQEKWTLSADGKTIASAVHIVAPMGEADMTVVLDKQ